jgi:hypothetical protein
MRIPLRSKICSTHLFILPVFLVGCLLSSCKKEYKPLPENYKFSEKSVLTWDDFKGIPGMFDGEWAATTCSGIGIDYDCKSENGKLVIVFTAYSFFDPDDSWVRKKSKNNWVLQHEQLHFYVSELNARLLRKSLAEFPFTSNYEKEIASLYYDAVGGRRIMQKKYDDESEHGLNKKMQVWWVKYVTAQLAELQPYASETVTNKTDVPMTDQQLIMANSLDIVEE